MERERRQRNSTGHSPAAQLLREGKFGEAEPLLRQLLALDPSSAQAWNHLGICRKKQGDSEEAFSCYTSALTLEPSNHDALNNLGVLLMDEGNLSLAETVLRLATSAKPDFAMGHYNRANAMRSLGRLANAEQEYDRAIALDPSFAGAHWNRGLTRLQAGDWARGWRDFDQWGEAAGERRVRSFRQPRWQGEPLRGKTILAHGEQGVGDEIMYAGFLPHLISLAGHVVVECDPRLQTLFARSFPRAEVIPRDAESTHHVPGDFPAVDFNVPAAVLPGFLPSACLPPAGRPPYLNVDDSTILHWRQRLADLGPGLRVGVSWRGGAVAATQRQRSIPLRHWKPILTTPGVQFVDLQYGDHLAERVSAQTELGIRLHRFCDMDPVQDLDSFAALIAALDLVISVDNSTVHIAGATGTPVWTLLPSVPDWRWMLDREATIWYRVMRLFRQQGADWAPVLDRVAGELRALSAAGCLNREEVTSVVEAVSLPPASQDGSTGRREGGHAMPARSKVSRSPSEESSNSRPLREDAHPSDSDILVVLGQTLAESGREAEAFTLLQRAAEIDPKRTEAILLMAAILLKEGHPQQAVELAEAVAVSDASRAPAALAIIGDAYAGTEAAEAALEAYCEADRLQPGQPQILDRLEALGKILSAP